MNPRLIANRFYAKLLPALTVLDERLEAVLRELGVEDIKPPLAEQVADLEAQVVAAGKPVRVPHRMEPPAEPQVGQLPDSLDQTKEDDSETE